MVNLPTFPQEEIARLAKNIAEAKDRYIQSYMEAFDLSLTEFLRHYVIEEHPIEVKTSDECGYQDVRLVFTIPYRIRIRTPEEYARDHRTDEEIAQQALRTKLGG